KRKSLKRHLPNFHQQHQQRYPEQLLRNCLRLLCSSLFRLKWLPAFALERPRWTFILGLMQVW
ncbi:hypothetical protein, partial [Oscillibacter ruminantium]|uniref:hypothetical protein n=1 Tax=Oscillibacter ruminantium TaxID=1263547 RepID=UPI001A9A464E